MFCVIQVDFNFLTTGSSITTYIKCVLLVKGQCLSVNIGILSHKLVSIADAVVDDYLFLSISVQQSFDNPAVGISCCQCVYETSRRCNQHYSGE